jgi:choline dehydrogenase-like flavoprotein
VTTPREVILCGGLFNSPQLLMLSGIGPAAHLRDTGIQTLVSRRWLISRLVGICATILAWM